MEIIATFIFLLFTLLFLAKSQSSAQIHEENNNIFLEDENSNTSTAETEKNVIIVNSTFGTEQSNIASIVGGGYATLNQHHFFTGIRYENGALDCGGALIHPNWVITAAHCVVNTDEDVASLEIGKFSMDFNNAGQYMEYRRIDHKCICPSYDGIDNDIALLYIHEPSIITPAKIDSGHVPLKNYEPLTLLGLGSIGASGHGPLPYALQEAKTHYLNNNKCMKAIGFPIADTILCARTSFPGGACSGDSGGPLFVNGGAYDGTLIGIVSFGLVPCDGTLPGLYTRISKYKGWIKKVLNGNGHCA